MCDGFGGFYHRNGTVFFIEPNEYGNISHRDVLGRMPAQFKNNKDLVAFEFPKWTIKSFVWDHPGTIPDWADKDKCIRTFRLVKPVWLEYRKAREQARAEYEKACDPIWAEYEKARAQAHAEYDEAYDEACDQAWEEYDGAYERVFAEYKTVYDQVYFDYDKACDQVLTEYKKVYKLAQDKMINNLSEIEGYLKEIQRLS